MSMKNSSQCMAACRGEYFAVGTRLRAGSRTAHYVVVVVLLPLCTAVRTLSAAILHVEVAVANVGGCYIQTAVPNTR